MLLFVLGIMIGLMLFLAVFRKEDLSGKAWVWLSAPVYIALVETTQMGHTHNQEIISSKAIFVSLAFLATFVTCLPPRASNTKLFGQVFICLSISYMSAIASLALFTQPTSAVVLMVFCAFFAILAAWLRLEAQKDKQIASTTIVAILFMVAWADSIFVSNPTPTETQLVAVISMLALLGAQLLILGLLLREKREVRPDPQWVAPHMLANWLETNRLIKTYAHDLKQPLSTINIVSGVGKAIAENDETRQRFQHTMAAHNSLTTMLDDFMFKLKEMANMSFKPPVHQLQHLSVCELDPIFKALFEEYQYFAQAKGLSLRIASTNLCALSDRIALEKILRNGLDNAIKYTAEGGVVMTVRHSWKCELTGEIVIQIFDTGSGIDNDRVASKDKGWGFGSDIIHTLGKRINANIEISNRPGRASGTCFTVCIPHYNPKRASELRSGLSDTQFEHGKPPILILRGLSDESSKKPRTKLPSALPFEDIHERDLEELVHIDRDYRSILFYLMTAHNERDLLIAQELVRLYSDRRGQFMSLMVVVEESELWDIRVEDFPELAITQARLVEGRLEIPVLEDLMEVEHKNSLPPATPHLAPYNIKKPHQKSGANLTSID